MKTLLITLEYPPQTGGVSNYYENLVKYWPEKENIQVLDNKNNQLLKAHTPLAWLKSIGVIKKYIKKYQPDKVLVGQVLPLGIVVYFLSFFLKFKYVLIFHGMDYAWIAKKLRKKLISKLIIKRAKTIIVGNSYTKELIYTDFPKLEEKIKVVNPGIENNYKINESLYSELQEKYKDKKIIFSLGRLVKRKGFDKVIQALDYLTEENILYVIAGTGPEEESLKKLASKHGNKVLFLGEIKAQEKWTWFKLSNLFIMTPQEIQGDFEGFGIVYLEANLMAKPVIATNTGGVRDAIENEINGLLLKDGSIVNISTYIDKLLKNESYREKLGQQGRERVLNNFLWPVKIKEFYNYIK